MYKYFCKLSLGLKFGEFYFGFKVKLVKYGTNSVSFSVSNLRQTSSLFVSESAFYLYAYTCGKIYIERTQGCKFMNLRTHTHIYKTKIPPFDIISQGRTN